MGKGKQLILLILMQFIFSCADNKAYNEARKIAITQYALSCTGGSSNSCKSSCDGKCGIDSTSAVTSAKIDCAKTCTDDCNRNCNTIILFLFNTKD